MTKLLNLVLVSSNRQKGQNFWTLYNANSAIFTHYINYVQLVLTMIYHWLRLLPSVLKSCVHFGFFSLASKPIQINVSDCSKVMNGNCIIFKTHWYYPFACVTCVSLCTSHFFDALGHGGKPGRLQCIMYYLKAKKNGEMRKVYRITEFIALMLWYK